MDIVDKENKPLKGTMLSTDTILGLLKANDFEPTSLDVAKVSESLNLGVGRIVENIDKDANLDMRRLDLEEKKAALERCRDIHKWRNIYLARSFYLVGYVIYVSLSFLLFSAVGLFQISNDVMITLLTTMVANTIGVLLVAFAWLYNKKEAK